MGQNVITKETFITLGSSYYTCAFYTGKIGSLEMEMSQWWRTFFYARDDTVNVVWKKPAACGSIWVLNILTLFQWSVRVYTMKMFFCFSNTLLKCAYCIPWTWERRVTISMFSSNNFQLLKSRNREANSHLGKNTKTINIYATQRKRLPRFINFFILMSTSDNRDLEQRQRKRQRKRQFKMNSRFFNLCRVYSNLLKMASVGEFR